MLANSTSPTPRFLKLTLLFAAWLVSPFAAAPLCHAADVGDATEASSVQAMDWEASIPLFNGSDLAGWDGDSRLWSVRAGVIHGETTPENSAKGNTFLIWEGGEVEDFALRVVYRCNSANNSGVQYRSERIDPPRARNGWVVIGYQHEIRNENTPPNVPGFIYDEGGKRGRLCLAGEKAVWGSQGKKVIEKLLEDQAIADLINIDGWNESVIVARGNHIRHYLNGELILDFTDEHPEATRLSGVVALQLHAGKPMWAEFKEVKLLRLE